MMKFVSKMNPLHLQPAACPQKSVKVMSKCPTEKSINVSSEIFSLNGLPNMVKITNIFFFQIANMCINNSAHCPCYHHDDIKYLICDLVKSYSTDRTVVGPERGGEELKPLPYFCS